MKNYCEKCLKKINLHGTVNKKSYYKLNGPLNELVARSQPDKEWDYFEDEKVAAVVVVRNTPGICENNEKESSGRFYLWEGSQ